MDTFLIDTFPKFLELQTYSNQEFEYLALDTETNSVIERKASIYGVGLCFLPDEAFYIPFRHPNGDKWWGLEEEAHIISWIKNKCSTLKILCHNGVYDILVIKYNWNFDISEHLYADTILMKHLVDEERPFGLKEIAVKYLGPNSDKAQKTLYENIEKNGGKTTKDNMEMWKADTNVLADYCAWDVLLTRQLFDLFDLKIKQEGTYDLFYKDEIMPLYKECVIPMKDQGFCVDVDYFNNLNVEIKKCITDIEEQIQGKIEPLVSEFCLQLLDENYPVKKSGSFPKVLAEHYNIQLPTTKSGNITLSKGQLIKHQIEHPFYDWLLSDKELPKQDIRAAQLKWYYKDNPDTQYIFNLKSNDHLKHLFFKKLQHTPISKTEKGEPQVNDDFIESLKGRYDWVNLLLDYKKLMKLQSTYIEGVLERQIDGYIYASFLLFGTTSGRFSCTNINLQNIPRVKEEDSGLSEIVLKFSNAIKAGFVAPKGYKIVNSDFCLHKKTELLTSKGWKFVLDLNEDDEVWQINPNSLIGSWVKPSRLVKRLYTGKMYSFGNQRGHLDVTENHTMLWGGQFHPIRSDKERYRKISKSQELIPNSACNFITGSTSTQTFSNFSETEIWTACMLQADGNFYQENTNSYKIEVSTIKKRKKVRELLGIPSNENQNLERESWCTRFTSPLLTKKHLNVDLIGSNQMSILLEALAFWDGSYRKTQKNRFVWGTTNKQLAEEVQSKLVREGCEAKISVKKYTNINWQDFYTLSIKPQNRLRVRKQDYRIYDYSGMVGCVTVPEGFILVRSEGQTFVTGNCQLEPRAFAEACEDKLLQQGFIDKEDLYGSIAKNIWALDCTANEVKKKYGEKRQLAKCFVKGTKISTQTGTKSIENINIGDLVLTSKGYKKVINLTHRKASVGLFCTNRGFLTCTPDHKIFSSQTKDFKEAQDFKKEEEIYFQPLNVKYDLPYNKLSVFSAASYTNGFKAPYANLTFKTFGEKDGRGQKNLEIQDYVFNSPLATKLSFVAGLLDTDGYLKYNTTKNTSAIAIASKSSQLISDLCKLLNDIGIETVTRLDWNKTHERYYYLLVFTKKGIKKAFELGLDKFLVCPRKKEAISQFKDVIPRKNSNQLQSPRFKAWIDLQKEETVYDITVEEEHEFFASNILVHNCVALAVVYGAEAGRISQLIGSEYEEAQQIIKDYLNAYPGLKDYMKRCDYNVVTKGYVSTKLGRIRHLPEAKLIYNKYGWKILDKKWAKMNKLDDLRWKLKNMLNLAKNHPIQGVAAHIVNRAMIAATRKFKENGIDAKIIAMVHDEITCIAKEDQAEEAAKILKDAMENTTKIAVPLESEPLIADNWAEAK